MIELSIRFDNFSNLVISLHTFTWPATKSLVGLVHGEFWLMFDFLLHVCAININDVLTLIQPCFPAQLNCKSTKCFIWCCTNIRKNCGILFFIIIFFSTICWYYTYMIYHIHKQYIPALYDPNDAKNRIILDFCFRSFLYYWQFSSPKTFLSILYPCSCKTLQTYKLLFVNIRTTSSCTIITSYVPINILSKNSTLHYILLQTFYKQHF